MLPTLPGLGGQIERLEGPLMYGFLYETCRDAIGRDRSLEPKNMSTEPQCCRTKSLKPWQLTKALFIR